MKGHTQERSHLPAPSGFLTRPMKEHIGEKTHHCKQCDKKFSIFFLKKKQVAKVLATLFATIFLTNMLFHGYGEKSTWSRQMASLLCGSFHAYSNEHFFEKSFHTSNGEIASLMCGSFHEPSN